MSDTHSNHGPTPAKAVKSRFGHFAIAQELCRLVYSLARGKYPDPQTSPFDRDEYERENWARSTALHVVGAAMSATERLGGPYPSPDQMMLREIARKALWHMPNSDDELKKLREWFKLENLRQPHPGDDKAPEM